MYDTIKDRLKNSNWNFLQLSNTSTAPVSIESLHALYEQHKEIFQRDAFNVQSTTDQIQNLDELFKHFLNESSPHTESHSLWRINRMTPARLLRKLVPSVRLPVNAAIGIERYVAIDLGTQSYALPTTDCSNMFIYQAKGERTIVLRPTAECIQQCRTISVRLKENVFCEYFEEFSPATRQLTDSNYDSLAVFYDWWYWKPISVADPHAKSMSISFIGSYC